MRHPVTALLAAGLLFAAARAEAADELKPVHLTKVNTEADEDDPHPASPALLYYAANPKGRFEIHVATKTGTTWNAGKVVFESPGKSDARSPFLEVSKTEQRLYYATNHELDAKDERGKNYDLQYRARGPSGGEFILPTPVNSAGSGADEAYPWVTTDGKLYFSRRTKDGWQVLVSERAKGGGPFGKPSEVDLPPDFGHPSLSSDGKTMYLQGPAADGKTAIFRSRKTAEGKWTEPEEIAGLAHAESKTGDRSPALSKDGLNLFFASDRPGGAGGLDIWFIPVMALPKSAK